MNCNTTHYRANSSSVPGDPTYRTLSERFDRVVSIGMFEHVGYKNYRTYFAKARGLLKEDGLFLLHSIGGNRSTTATDPWLDRYIFPGGMLPSIRQVGEAIEGLFVMEDWHNFGAYYDKTLTAWLANFNAAWPTLKETYGDPSRRGGAEAGRFYRMWVYYLSSCAATFRARRANLWQIVLSPRSVPGGYVSVR